MYASIKNVSSNPVHGEVYSIQHHVKNIATGRWFSPGPPVALINKTDRHDITEILLKVALNTINQTFQMRVILIYYRNNPIPSLGVIGVNLSVFVA